MTFNTLAYVKKSKNKNLATKIDLKEMESRLIIRLGSLIAFSTGVIATLIKIL